MGDAFFKLDPPPPLPESLPESMSVLVRSFPELDGFPVTALDRSEAHVRLRFAAPMRVISSAVLGGGLIRAAQMVNVRVGERFMQPKESGHCDPAEALLGYCRDRGWIGTDPAAEPVVGMMTAASMRSLRIEFVRWEAAGLAVFVTSGLSNALRAGDPAECLESGLDGAGYTPGTINIMLLSNVALAPAAQVECVQMITEAKAAVLRELDVPSVVSGEPATGTGTDAVAVACPDRSGTGMLRYAGKHVPFGEGVARAVMRALRASLQWKGGRSCAD